MSCPIEAQEPLQEALKEIETKAFYLSVQTVNKPLAEKMQTIQNYPLLSANMDVLQLVSKLLKIENQTQNEKPDDTMKKTEAYVSN